MSIDAVELTRALIRCPSVTPADAGALAVLEDALTKLGFRCERMRFEQDGTAPIDNLYARLGAQAPVLAFAGHTDVVPPGPAEAWRHNPFAGEIADGNLYGRGASDMKGGIAAFIAAVSTHLARQGKPRGSIALLITGDEEDVAINGTKKMLEKLAERGEKLDVCVVGEPTNPDAIGDMVKIGRRGSLTGTLTVKGTQGHVAYPQRADNPIPRMIATLAALKAQPLDAGTEFFDPSNLEVVSMWTDTKVTNVIPGAVHALFNVRFNDTWNGATLEAHLRKTIAAHAGAHDLAVHVSGESFRTAPGAWTSLVAGAIETVTGRKPDLSTTGGTSDARFIARYCPVVEFGLVGRSMHKIDEHVALDDLAQLTRVYEALLERYFA
ncbi:succinyl-diaminopimelate desuccinylase [Roseiterribacter gracilis]|uniref:Succinyl-diaminopimelate desuccinylase n=1 Tax=Roseiterribacter gracilis TaxID=2812848 RepID=A0A8S8XDU9_9PROT|nr:succinyl-diaminopimelate desuccinylase [Rhodospirillales bacterium TMPK1]